MEPGGLIHHSPPKLEEGRLVLAFTGWMDGGDVSTGTVDWLISRLITTKVAEIDPQGYYIYNFPGSMELSALFRPHTRIFEGIIEQLGMPESRFYCDEANHLVLFRGKEPNLNWEAYADRIFSFASEAGISRIWFVGSYAGMTPHTREPRMTTSVSDPALKLMMEQLGIRLANYEGPASFSTLLIRQARDRGFEMASLVAEIPSYIQGTNPRCIEAVVRKLMAILELQVDLDELRQATNVWEHKVTEAVSDREDLTELIGKLEAACDNEVFDNEMGDLKTWLEQKGIQLD